AAVVSVAVVASACASRASSPAVEPAGPTVVLRPTDRPAVSVKVELARTDAARQRGLMYRDRLEPDHGMLFIFDNDAQQSFWMKNPYIPLDMIFITSGLRVLGVVENAEPLTTTPRFVKGVSRYVLEVVGGYAQQHGITAGTPVELRNVQ